jgi:hypothetical protein
MFKAPDNAHEDEIRKFTKRGYNLKEQRGSILIFVRDDMR